MSLPKVRESIIADVPVISICIPAYREVDFLRRAIASCLIQSYMDFEVVVTDDTEDDSVFRLVEQMAAEDRRIRYFRNPGPHGAAANSNYSVKMSKGEWIKFLYHDDEFAGRDSLQKFVDASMCADFITSACYCMNNNSKSIHHISKDKILSLRNSPVRSLIDKGNFIGPPSAVMIRKKSFCGFDPKMVWKFDLFLYLKLLCSGTSYIYLEGPLVTIHQHSNQLTNRVGGLLGTNFRESFAIIRYVSKLEGYYIFATKKMVILILNKFYNYIKRSLNNMAGTNTISGLENKSCVGADDLRKISFYSKIIKGGDIVYDVGANIGNRVRIFSRLNAVVVAFEPQKKCANYLLNIARERPDVIVVNKALGSSEGYEEMFISNADTISSLSANWIESVKKSGRFSEYVWNKKELVEVTTLDESIKKYGRPSFIKIDVEGYEYEVIRGLSEPINCISFEFTPEFLEDTFRCIDHLQRISTKTKYQISIGESMEFYLDFWVSAEEVKQILASLNPLVFGDVYIKCE